MNVPSVPSVTSHAEIGEDENLLKRSSGVLFHEPAMGEPFMVIGMTKRVRVCGAKSEGDIWSEAPGTTAATERR